MIDAADGTAAATVNIARMAERAARHYPDKPAILFEDRCLSYRELDHAASRTAHALAKRGVETGDRVALYLPNIPAFGIAYQAVQKLGAIVVSASAMLTTDELAALLEDSGAGVVFTVEALWPRIAPLVGDLVRRDRIVICEGEVAGQPTLDELGAGEPDGLRAREVEPSAPAAIPFTSGTTGCQKAATLSHANIASNVAAVNRYMRTGPADRVLVMLPLFHVAAQNVLMNGGFAAAAALALHRRFDATRCADADRGAPHYDRHRRPDHLHHPPERRRAAGRARKRAPVQVGRRHDAPRDRPPSRRRTSFAAGSMRPRAMCPSSAWGSRRRADSAPRPAPASPSRPTTSVGSWSWCSLSPGTSGGRSELDEWGGAGRLDGGRLAPARSDDLGDLALHARRSRALGLGGRDGILVDDRARPGPPAIWTAAFSGGAPGESAAALADAAVVQDLHAGPGQRLAKDAV